MRVPHGRGRTAIAALLCGIIAPTPLYARPITLPEVLARAEDNSPSVVQARGELAVAAARARQAGVRPNPQVNLTVENFAGSGEFRRFRSAEVTLSVSQQFELGGKRSSRRAIAAAELEVAELRVGVARADVERDARTNFAELSGASDRVTLARDAEQRARELQRTVTLLVVYGREPPLRGLRAKAALAEAEAATQAAIAAYARSQRSLAGLLGFGEVDLEARGAVELLAPAQPTADPGSSLVVRLAAAERLAAEARVKLEQATAVPDLTAELGVKRFEGSNDTAVIAGISVPIPIANRNGGAIDAARASLNSAEARLSQARLDAIRSLRGAESDLIAADARVRALQSSGICQAREAVRLARIGYAAGKFSFLEVLDAQSALNQAEAALIDARLAQAQAVAALMRAQAQ